MTDALRRPLPKPMLAVSCLVLCAACQGEASDPGATGRAAAADLFSAWPGDESLRIAAEPSAVVGSDESLPLGTVWEGSGAGRGRWRVPAPPVPRFKFTPRRLKVCVATG